MNFNEMAYNYETKKNTRNKKSNEKRKHLKKITHIKSDIRNTQKKEKRREK